MFSRNRFSTESISIRHSYVMTDIKERKKGQENRRLNILYRVRVNVRFDRSFKQFANECTNEAKLEIGCIEKI